MLASGVLGLTAGECAFVYFSVFVCARVCVGVCSLTVLRLVDKILHDPKDPKLWEL